MVSEMAERATDRKGKMANQIPEANGSKVDEENSNGMEENASGMGKVRKVNQWKGTAVARYGKDGHASNEEWLYTLKVEKSYGAIVRGTSVMLLQEYLEPLFAITGKLGHR